MLTNSKPPGPASKTGVAPLGKSGGAQGSGKGGSGGGSSGKSGMQSQGKGAGGKVLFSNHKFPCSCFLLMTHS